LNVIKFTKPGSGIEFTTFDKETADRIKRFLVLMLTQQVEGFQDCAIEKSCAELSASIHERIRSTGIAKIDISSMGALN